MVNWFESRFTKEQICEMAGAFNFHSDSEYGEAMDLVEKERVRYINKIEDDPSWKPFNTLDMMCEAHFMQYLTFDINL